MPKVISTLFISADGVAEIDPEWHFPYFDDGDAPYHLRTTATEVFPTGVIRVIYAPTPSPTPAGTDAVEEDQPAAPSS